MTHLLSQSNSTFREVSVVSDLYIARTNGSEEYYSFKTVKPNLDQTEIAKKDMLLLLAGNSDRKVFFALPFNPAGEGNQYRKAGHTIPFRIFDMDKDPCVLIGAKLWNQIGQDENTYKQLLGIFEGVGERTRNRIEREYF